MRRREVIAGLAAAAVADKAISAIGAFTTGPGGILAPLGTGSSQSFDYYISTTGNDSNSGTLGSPWTINSLSPYSSGSALTNYNTKIAGKKIGLLPGTYGVGALCTAAYSGNGTSGIALDLPGGSVGNPTYVASSNSSGFYQARTATLQANDTGFYGGANGNASAIIGQSYIYGTHGYITIDGLKITGGAVWGVNFGNIAGNNYTAPGMTLQNCEITGFNAQSNTHSSGQNVSCIQILSCSGATVTNNWIHDNVGWTDATHFAAIYHWGLGNPSGNGTINSTITYNTLVNSGGMMGKEGYQAGTTIAYNYIDMSLMTPSGGGGQMGGIYGFAQAYASTALVTNIHHNIIKSFTGTSGTNALRGQTWISLIGDNAGSSGQVAWYGPVHVYNNTMVGTSDLNGCGMAYFEQVAGTQPVTDYNNLFWDAGFNEVAQFGWYWCNPDIFTLCDYNILGTHQQSGVWATFSTNGTNIGYGTAGYASNLAGFASTTGTSAHSSTNSTNPFTNNGTYALQYQVQAGSPAYQTGKVGGTSGGATCNVGAWDGSVTQIGCNFA